MSGLDFTELKRRTIVKSLVWRVIGVAWTWIGAYLIIVSVPPSWKNAPVIATLIVIYHHSTRMIMYYFYERIWSAVSWGKYDVNEDKCIAMSVREKLIWTSSTAAVVVFIFSLIIYMMPLIKNMKG